MLSDGLRTENFVGISAILGVTVENTSCSQKVAIDCNKAITMYCGAAAVDFFIAAHALWTLGGVAAFCDTP